MPIILYCGPMYSGKSKDLIQKYTTDKDTKIAIKPKTDTRNGNVIHTRYNDKKIPCIVLDNIDVSNFRFFKNIYIDEYQFFQSEQLLDLINFCKLTNKNLFIYGLDLTFEKKEWASFTAIKDKVDRVERLTAECTVDGCHEDAIYSCRVYENQLANISKAIIEIEGLNQNYKYEPRCRKHFE